MKLLLICLLMCSAGFADGVGKIAGRVVDENGDGVIGANVLIEGTHHGASVTNPDGSYVLLGVEPGKYSLQFSSTDLRQQRFTDVEVVSNRTTTVNAVLTAGFKIGLEGTVCGYKKHRPQLGEALKIHMGPPFFIEKKPQVELPPQFRIEPRYRHYLTQPSGRDCY